ncbi:hypothetical protein LguiA_035767 [Lonicera macranthoides]
MAAGNGKYSCRTATETLEWIHAIIDFIKPYTFFIEAHVVNFFKDRLWEAVDKEWIDSLRNESVENLLQIPSGVVQDQWPPSLKDFVLAIRSFALPREQADLKKVLPDIHTTPLDKVLTQGMNRKKKHEELPDLRVIAYAVWEQFRLFECEIPNTSAVFVVNTQLHISNVIYSTVYQIEALSAVVWSIARSVGASTTIDVGAGQGYLAQVLTFHYQLSVIAIDACSHHGRITDARAERIKKHYAAMMRKSRLENRDLSLPKTVTCSVLSTDILKTLSNSLIKKDDVEQLHLIRRGVAENSSKEVSKDNPSCMLLAGLHACGDLSVTMLRTFLECKEVKAVVSIGCCYNLLSEEGDENAAEGSCGFPMSKGVKSVGFSLGKSSRDLACQSADRWRGLGEDAGLHNFELHAFRAAFQMVLSQHYPDILTSSPTIGRQGKALRRQQNRAIIESTLHQEGQKEGSWPTIKCAESDSCTYKGSAWGTDTILLGASCNHSTKSEKTTYVDKFSQFEKFSKSGLCRLGLQHLQDMDLAGIWKETESFAELIGPYWTLRAALGPVLETLILLDRLLFLQEEGSSVESLILPIFDPALSPRNMALIAKKI